MLGLKVFGKLKKLDSEGCAERTAGGSGPGLHVARVPELRAGGRGHAPEPREGGARPLTTAVGGEPVMRQSLGAGARAHPRGLRFPGETPFLQTHGCPGAFCAHAMGFFFVPEQVLCSPPGCAARVRGPPIPAAWPGAPDARRRWAPDVPLCHGSRSGPMAETSSSCHVTYWGALGTRGVRAAGH